MTEQPKSPVKSLVYIAAVLLLMFGFGFFLVPIYNFVCDQLGVSTVVFDSETLRADENDAAEGFIDTSRVITVVFDSKIGDHLPWEFGSLQREVKVHPGQLARMDFVAKNTGSSTIAGEAKQQVSPAQVKTYISKTDCFCFREQLLKPGESKEMSVVFTLSNKIPEHVDRVTLSYTFFVQNENVALLD